ncbi:MAG TPA: tRNA pseudouridine(55) synthase TruB [Pyrinomonadaceae bacterium]|nr:tRNA pseudouridine(55) synthase TruB [Pyrinomonadaceae bacterium]
MDGILVIDKPEGLTSHDVVSRVRRILRTRRVGHTGTLDPFATGVLVVLVGKATRLAQFIDKDIKEYEATVQFGWETDTGDITGTPSNAERGMRNAEFVEQALAATDWNAVLSKFRGDILQTPPMYSAKKIEGKKLYELAREGVTIERKPVRVTIHELDLSPEEFRIPRSAFRIRVSCSAGTYIRTLAEDIGREIDVGAHLTELRRTHAGRFSIDDAITLDRLSELDDPSTELRPLAEAVEHLTPIALAPDRVAKAKEGLSTRIAEDGLADRSFVRILNETSELIAIGIYNSEEKSVKPKIVLV